MADVGVSLALSSPAAAIPPVPAEQQVRVQLQQALFGGNLDIVH